jgi:hypothetical protein
MTRIVTVVVFSTLVSACCGSFKTAVRAWASGPAYKGAVERVNKDSELDDTSKRLELMSLSGLACTLDLDSGASTSEKPSAACACSLPTQVEAQVVDCKKWTESL